MSELANGSAVLNFSSMRPPVDVPIGSTIAYIPGMEVLVACAIVLMMVALVWLCYKLWNWFIEPIGDDEKEIDYDRRKA